MTMSSYRRLPADPATKLSDIGSMSRAEIQYAEMEAKQIVQGLLTRYKAKGDAFLTLVARHLTEELNKRNPVQAKPVTSPQSDSDDGMGLF